jgi:hypothetical protein
MELVEIACDADACPVNEKCRFWVEPSCMVDRDDRNVLGMVHTCSMVHCDGAAFWCTGRSTEADDR